MTNHSNCIEIQVLIVLRNAVLCGYIMGSFIGVYADLLLYIGQNTDTYCTCTHCNEFEQHTWIQVITIVIYMHMQVT